MLGITKHSSVDDVNAALDCSTNNERRIMDTTVFYIASSLREAIRKKCDKGVSVAEYIGVESDLDATDWIIETAKEWNELCERFVDWDEYDGCFPYDMEEEFGSAFVEFGDEPGSPCVNDERIHFLIRLMKRMKLPIRKPSAEEAEIVQFYSNND